MGRLSRTQHLVPSRSQGFLWSKNTGAGSDARRGRSLDCAATEGARTVGSGEEGGGANDVNRLPQKLRYKCRSAW